MSLLSWWSAKKQKSQS